MYLQFELPLQPTLWRRDTLAEVLERTLAWVPTHSKHCGQRLTCPHERAKRAEGFRIGRQRVEAAGRAIHAYETHLTDTMINGSGNLPGLRDMPHVQILGGADNPAREGLVSIVVTGRPSPDVVTTLNEQGIRTHTRKADHYSGNVLDPLGLSDCIRISLCHYNSEAEIRQLLAALKAMGPG